MTVHEAVKSVLQIKSYTQKDLGEKVGKTQPSLSRSLRSNITINNLIEILEVLNCQIVIEDIDTGNTYVVDEMGDIDVTRREKEGWS